MSSLPNIPPPPDGSAIVPQGAIPPPPDGSSIVAAHDVQSNPSFWDRLISVPPAGRIPGVQQAAPQVTMEQAAKGVAAGAVAGAAPFVPEIAGPVAAASKVATKWVAQNPIKSYMALQALKQTPAGDFLNKIPGIDLLPFLAVEGGATKDALRKLGIKDAEIESAASQAQQAKATHGPEASPELLQGNALGKVPPTGAQPAAATGEALNTVPNKFTPAAEAAPAPVTKKVVSAAVDDALNVKPFQAKPGVPIRSQVTPRTASPTAGLTPGHTAVDSSALSSYKYDAEANELHLVTNSNPKTVYVYGDVSADQAEAFKNADSKGKAWAELKQQGSPLVAKIISGKRIPVRPISAPVADITLPPGKTEDDLAPQLQESLRRIRAARAGRQPQ